MSVFADVAEAEQILGRPWELLGEDPEVGPKIGALNKVYVAEYEDPAAKLTIYCADGTVRVERGVSGEADATLRMSADTGNRFWQGAVNLPMALAKKEVALDGKMSDVMACLPYLGPGYELYKQYLHDQGREDLIGR